jgi:hypothetical protein
VKKLISIGIVLALLALVVLPGAVGAAGPYTPKTFATIPFAILASTFELITNEITTLGPTLGLPDWLGNATAPLADYSYGPLAWSVDMVAWMLAVGDVVLDPLAVTLGLPDWLAPVLGDLAGALWWCYNVTCTAMPALP